MTKYEEAISFEALYESMLKCKKGVIWKDSVASYYLNGIERTLKLEAELQDGTYKSRPAKKFTITHPKRREAVSIAFRDRVYQRSLNDNIIYPTMTKSFIHANMACQKGKGTDKARDLLDKYLREFCRTHRTDGHVLQCDIKGYYENMRHDITEAAFKKKLDRESFEAVKRILRTQYDKEIGYNPGSQLVQIAGISVLDPMDHFIKEKLKIKYYIRYMDDFVLIHQDENYLEYCKEEIKRFLRKYSFELHHKKTKIYKITHGITFLGFNHRLTSTGKIVRNVKSENIKSYRKKMYRLVNLEKKNKIKSGKSRECLNSELAHLRKGNSCKVSKRLEKYYSELWKEAKE